MLFTALEPLGPRNSWSGLLRCCWSVRQGRLALFRCCQGAQNGRSKPPLQPLGPRNGRLGPPRFWWSAQQGRLGLFRRCQGAQIGCSEPPVKLLPASLPSGREVHGQAKTVLFTAPEPLGPRNGQSCQLGLPAWMICCHVTSCWRCVTRPKQWWVG